ncbi:hypothetical protein [Pseudonocardia xishanensis]|uniref:hypothetical protein n=1 Tax=Pseudonocardia xishanensis TaxID=630995 RepID=UPI0031EAE165
MAEVLASTPPDILNAIHEFFSADIALYVGSLNRLSVQTLSEDWEIIIPDSLIKMT